MRRMLGVVLVVAALALCASPAAAQEATVVESDLPSLVSSLALLFDDGGACTGVPDTIPGIFDFTDACTAHDACYAAGEQTRAACDAELLEDMNATCLVQHPSALAPGRFACLFFAQLYHAGVRLFGRFF